jgi:hypothetical protein
VKIVGGGRGHQGQRPGTPGAAALMHSMGGGAAGADALHGCGWGCMGMTCDEATKGIHGRAPGRRVRGFFRENMGD